MRSAARTLVAQHATVPGGPVSASAPASPDLRPTAVAPRPAPAAAPCCVPPNTSAIKVLRQPIEFALAALVGVHDHRADVVLAAADRDRHPQRGGGQVRVVVGTDREPDDPP